MLKDRPGDNQTIAFRCGTCNLNWPAHIDYKMCKQCGEDLRKASAGVTPMDFEEAKSLVSQIKFAEYYETTRGVPVDAETDPRFDPYRPGVTTVDNLLLLPERT